jgi:alkylation response protein AidB-like acyl-CoA dehydrogenase
MGILAASPEPGMDLTLTESQRMVRDMARDFAVNEVLPRARELDKASRWPAELVAQMGALGLMGVAIPESSAARAWIT